jgi:undecaprenyl-diphosphatase
MSDLQIVVLALVQGITEFLPISSSAHLILVPLVTGWPDQGLQLDIAVHVGSLGAVLAYFRSDVSRMLSAVRSPGQSGAQGRVGGRLALLVVIGTLPILAVGFLLDRMGTDGLRSIAVIGWTSLLFGIALYLADRYAPNRRPVEEMGLGGALTIGIAQVIALVPGTSRAGITITAARLLGLRRDEAARFSMLLSIPTILGAGALLTLDLVELGQASLNSQVLLAAGLAFVSALVAIVLMMRWLQRASYTPFVVYRCALGLALLLYVYG